MDLQSQIDILSDNASNNPNNAHQTEDQKWQQSFLPNQPPSPMNNVPKEHPSVVNSVDNNITPQTPNDPRSQAPLSGAARPSTPDHHRASQFNSPQPLPPPPYSQPQPQTYSNNDTTNQSNLQQSSASSLPPPSPQSPQFSMMSLNQFTNEDLQAFLDFRRAKQQQQQPTQTATTIMYTPRAEAEAATDKRSDRAIEPETSQVTNQVSQQTQ